MDEKIKFYTERVKERERKQAETAQIEFEQSAAGKLLAETQVLRQELEKQNKQLEKQRADQAAQQAAAEHRRKIAEVRGFFLGALSSVIAGLIIYYWPVFVSFLFH